MAVAKRLNVALTLCISLGLLTGCITTGTATQRAVVRAKDRVAPALVHIKPVKEVFTRGERKEIVITGSGFIISEDGYVVTNEHVAGESSYVRCVLYNREEVDAEVVGTDPYTDLAVLKLKDQKGMPFVRMGKSKDLEQGQTVMALGSPHGLARSVSLGIISVTDRYLDEMGPRASLYNTWIQTDAAINPGNSGGPLVDLHGKVVGVNTRKLGNADNVGFAIPVEVVRWVVDQIIAHGRVRRSWIGETLQPMTSRTDDPSKRGVLLGSVDPLSPAREAGLQPGDIIKSVNGTPVHARFVEELPQVRRLIADAEVGSELTLEVMRAGETLNYHIVTEEMSDLRGEEIEFSEWGFTGSELTAEVIARARLDSRKGVLVSGVQVGGIASAAKLRQGDIILKMDEVEVENLAQFREIYDAAVESQKKLILLLIKRNALTLFVLVKQEPEEETAP